LELRVRNLTRAKLDRIDELAAERGMRRTEYVKWLLLSPHQAPMTDTELHQLLAMKARQGNMRAMELLARATPPVPAAGGGMVDAPAEPNSPYADVIAFSERRGQPHPTTR
jgi:hypothetical protein